MFLLTYDRMTADWKSLRSSSTDETMTSLGVCSPGVLLNIIKNLGSLCRCVCTLQYRCLSSVDNPFISLGDHSRVSGGCFERGRGFSWFRVNLLCDPV